MRIYTDAITFILPRNKVFSVGGNDNLLTLISIFYGGVNKMDMAINILTNPANSKRNECDGNVCH